MKPDLKKDWKASESSFRQFLNWLDEGVDSRGERYVEMRRRLVHYFDRRNCLSPDDLADETLNRVARRLEEEGAISDVSPPRYCYIVAKFVFLEAVRRGQHVQAEFDEGSGELAARVAESSDPDLPARQRLLETLEECLRQLASKDRDMILEYYRGEQRVKIERRRALASRMALTINALAIRACRVRDRLEACLKTHAAEA